MNRGNILRDYKLSPCIMERLKVIREKLQEDIIQSNPSWRIIAGKDESILDEEQEEFVDKSNEDNNDTLSKTSNQFLSTQFHFTQMDKHFEQNCSQVCESKVDITECLFEELECPNGRLDVSQLDTLTDEEVVEVVYELEKKLTVLGTYNLCCALNNMNLEQRIKYAAVFYNCLLLPKIMALEEPCRLLLSVTKECAQKYPEDAQKLIFLPLLNVDLKDVTIIDAIVSAFEPERRPALLMEYLMNVKELKSWHLHFLQTLISTRTDRNINNKFVQLLYEKASDLAKDKNFGKLVLSFVKGNNTFSEEQKVLLNEIANVNQTLFKKPIQNILKSV